MSWFVSLAPATLPRLQEVRVNSSVLLFTVALTLGTGVLFGLAPAIEYSRLGPLADLRESSRGAGRSRKEMRVSRALVALEVALCVVLLSGAGLLVRSFSKLLSVQPGFDARELVTAKIWLPVPNDPSEDRYQKAEVRAAFLKESLRRTRQLANVRQAAIGDISSLPIGGAKNQAPFLIAGRGELAANPPIIDFSTVTPEYFRVLRAPLVAGREFTESDDTAGQRVAIINERLARKYWSAGDALGKEIRFAAARGQQPPPIEIVGIVEDIRNEGLDAQAEPHIYLPAYQFPGRGSVIFTRTEARPGTIGPLERAEVQAVDPNIPVFGVRDMNEVLRAHLARRSFALRLLAVFAGVALLLAAMGIYGVTAYSFGRRTPEIGLRMALGASPADIVRMVAREGALMAATGLAAGALGTLALARFLSSMLFQVRPGDPLTLAAVVVLLAAVTMGACLGPAQRAMNVEPLEALRHE
jgi:putative ABC transport system permease protein